MEKRLRNLYEHDMNCFIQITKCLRFTIFIRAPRQLPHPRPQLRHYRGASFFFFTSCDEAHLNGERFKKPLWNMFFFSKCRYQNEISFTIVIRGRPGSFPIHHLLRIYSSLLCRGAFITMA